MYILQYIYATYHSITILCKIIIITLISSLTSFEMLIASLFATLRVSRVSDVHVNAWHPVLSGLWINLYSMDFEVWK